MPPVNASNIRSIWARLAFVALSAFWAAAGWFILLQGGFHKTYKFSKETTFVDGAGAVFMACVLLLLAFIAASVVLQSLGARRRAFVVLAIVFWVPPYLFLLRT